MQDIDPNFKEQVKNIVLVPAASPDKLGDRTRVHIEEIIYRDNIDDSDYDRRIIEGRKRDKTRPPIDIYDDIDTRRNPTDTRSTSRVETRIDEQVDLIITISGQTGVKLSGNKSFENWLIKQSDSDFLPRSEERLIRQITKRNAKDNLYQLYTWTNPEDDSREGYLVFLIDLVNWYARYADATDIVI